MLLQEKVAANVVVVGAGDAYADTACVVVGAGDAYADTACVVVVCCVSSC